jgi:hypothetical protein
MEKLLLRLLLGPSDKGPVHLVQSIHGLELTTLSMKTLQHFVTNGGVPRTRRPRNFLT